MAEAHAAHVAALHDPTGSARTFLGHAALPPVRVLHGAGVPTLPPAINRVAKAVRPGLVSPKAALYGYWMKWHTSNQSGRPLSMGGKRAKGQPPPSTLAPGPCCPP